MNICLDSRVDVGRKAEDNAEQAHVQHPAEREVVGAAAEQDAAAEVDEPVLFLQLSVGAGGRVMTVGVVCGGLVRGARGQRAQAGRRRGNVNVAETGQVDGEPDRDVVKGDRGHDVYVGEVRPEEGVALGHGPIELLVGVHDVVVDRVQDLREHGH